MIIELSRLIPLPLTEIDHSDSEVWEAESLIFKPGDRIFFYAESGKGKTSLLSVIYGIRKDYKGKVFFDSEEIRDLNSRQLSSIRKRKLSYIFQGLELFDELTALENIILKNRLTDFKSINEIREMAAKIGISAFLNRKAGQLSFGQKQRVAIIRALCQPFDFLLADEIFSHLDDKIKKECMELISDELVKQDAGILFTSLSGGTDRDFFTKQYRV
jgi:ABC-type lipoprotein export system ATPase subunit